MILLGIIILYLLLFLSVNRDGFWTLDNGLKYLAIGYQSTSPFASLNIPIPEPEIDPWKQATPLIPPFVHLQDDKIIPVFPPLFIVGSAMVCRLIGSGVLYWIPWVAALGVLIVMIYGFRKRFPENITAVIILALASPLAFYALTLWEHTLSI